MDGLIEKLDLQSFKTDGQMGEVEEDMAKNTKSRVNSITNSLKKVVIELSPKEHKLTKSEFRELIKDIKIDSLPQRFLVKLIGMRSCEGLWGSNTTRPLVDDMVHELRSLDKREDLPLLNVKVMEEGIKLTLHKHNRSSLPTPIMGLIPLKFVSYAVQDHRYAKVFAFILVKEMSSRDKVTECFSFLCDSIITCRKMALSTAQAFRRLEESLKNVPKDKIFQIKLESNKDGDEDENTEI